VNRRHLLRSVNLVAASMFARLGVYFVCVHVYVYVCVFAYMYVCMYVSTYVCSMYVLIPVAARSKAWVCSRLLAGTAGSNPAGGMTLSFECCVLPGRDLCFGLIARPEDSYLL